MLLDEGGDREAACESRRLGFDLDETERLSREREVKELSPPVFDSNRGRLHPREVYALLHVIFSDTNIQVYLHKKYYLSIGCSLDVGCVMLYVICKVLCY